MLQNLHVTETLLTNKSSATSMPGI
jgi:hypothetical protein